MEDMEQDPFDPACGDALFPVGHRMQAVALEEEDGKYGFLIRVQEGKKEGCIPLADVEIPSKTDRNYWPVREYVVWMANH